jgi:predicted negative regulator of RcsB-dependent stress response
MAVYDLEEQENIEALKAWWKQYGDYVSWAVTALCIAIVAVQGWRYYQRTQAESASVLYFAVSQAVMKKEMPKAKDATEELQKKYSGTAYAPRAALLLARLQLDTGDRAAAKTQLLWAVDHSDEEEMKTIARFRLATLLLDDKAYDEALRLIEIKHDAAFDGIFADLKGDILLAGGKSAEARAAYQEALAKLDAKSGYRKTVELKLEAVGGAQ